MKIGMQMTSTSHGDEVEKLCTVACMVINVLFKNLDIGGKILSIFVGEKLSREGKQIPHLYISRI